MYADLHTHVMPGVDDGSPDMDTSLKALSLLYQSGVKQVAVTPHVNLFFDTSGPAHFRSIRESEGWGVGGSDPLSFIPQGFKELQEAAAESGLGIELHQGGELNPEVACELGEEQLEAIALGPQGNRFVLMEVSLYHPFDRSWSKAADHLREHGYDILLAHPERAPNMGTPEAMDLLREEMGKGVRLQVNLSSLTSSKAGGLAKYLVSDGLAWCVASDFHPPQRPANLADLPTVLASAQLDRALAPLLGSERPWHLLDHGF